MSRHTDTKVRIKQSRGGEDRGVGHEGVSEQAKEDLPALNPKHDLPEAPLRQRGQQTQRSWQALGFKMSSS